MVEKQLSKIVLRPDLQAIGLFLELRSTILKKQARRKVALDLDKRGQYIGRGRDRNGRTV